MTTIFFDMDGTIANLYGVENWLEYLINKDATPYKKAEPLINLNLLARTINRLQKKGYKIGIITWLAKDSTIDYDIAVMQAKINWLRKHLKSVKFDEIHIVEYGIPKEIYVKTENDILFDDEEKNRNDWTGKAYNVDKIFEILKSLK